jgi:hypothetical protein
MKQVEKTRRCEGRRMYLDVFEDVRDAVLLLTLSVHVISFTNLKKL